MCTFILFSDEVTKSSKSLLNFCLLVLSVTKRGILISPLELWIYLSFWCPIKVCSIFYEFILLGTSKLLKLDLSDDLKKNIMKYLPLSLWFFLLSSMPYLIWIQLFIFVLFESTSFKNYIFYFHPFRKPIIYACPSLLAFLPV